jgi:predicted lipoprotein
VASSRLARLLALAHRPVRTGEIEGLPSGLTFAIPSTLITGTARFYGQGLGALVAATSPQIHTRVEGLFARAVSSLSALERVDVERALTERRPALEEASAAVKALELGVKVDMAGALGVTLTFVGGDGD